jgi:hypothetical protein
MNTLYTIMGFSGAVLSLFAYFQVSHGRWKGTSFYFQISNAFAAALLIVYGLHTHAYANILLNASWLLIAAVALKRLQHSRHK